LGKLLTAFYFHEEYVEIQKLILSKGFNENRASHDVMGVTYEDLAVAVAQYWHFPEQLVESLRELPDEEVKAPKNDVDALRIVADACAAVCGAIRITNPQKRDAAFEKIHKRFGEVLDLDQKELIDRIKEAGQALVVDTSLLNFRPSNNPFYLALTSFIKGHTPEEVAPANRNDLTFVIADATLKTLAPGQLHGSVPVGSERDPRNILSAGIQDITTSLAGKHELNDILRMILETMFRAINFTRVLLCVRDSGHNCLRSRFGFGAEIDRIIKGGFNIPLDVSNDVFGAALSTGADIYIEDVDSDRIREHIPDWYRNLITAKSLALFPVMVHKRPVALFYGDSDKAGDLRLAQGELSLLKTLRNQAILAIRQRG
jgi:eukaryotic-like serine/threonine-protein kinase